jgi:hypothetical protein
MATKELGTFAPNIIYPEVLCRNRTKKCKILRESCCGNMREYPKFSGLLQMVQLSATRCSCIAIL